MVVVLYTEEKTYTFATTQQLNELVGNSQDIAPVIAIDNIDVDKDGKNDEIKVKITLGGNISALKVKNVLIVQSVRYAIRDTIDAEFKLPIFNVFQAPKEGF